jgi:hypothetical protein
MVLKKSKSEKYSVQLKAKVEINEIRQQVYKISAYLGQRTRGVEVVGSQICDCMVFGELGKVPNSLVDIFFFLLELQRCEKDLPSQSSSKIWKGDAEGVELDVAQRTP